jgi:hypothetical protein
VWLATSSTRWSGFYLRIYTYSSTEVLCLWLWYKALTRRPTVLLCLRSIETWWGTATMKPCCSSAGHSNRDSTTTPLVLTGKTLPNNVVSRLNHPFHTPVTPKPRRLWLSPNRVTVWALYGPHACCVLYKLVMSFQWGFENLSGRTAVAGSGDTPQIYGIECVWDLGGPIKAVLR